VGPQYVASVHAGALQVAVREGSIAIDRGQIPVVALAGESLTVSQDGSVARSQVDSHGQAWHWAGAIAPEFAIEGRSLDEFLAWAGRETGRKIVYTSADAAREAEQTMLKGSTSGLAPEAAVLPSLHPSPPCTMHRRQIRVEAGRRRGRGHSAITRRPAAAMVRPPATRFAPEHNTLGLARRAGRVLLGRAARG
jgi:hypothetical protein